MDEISARVDTMWKVHQNREKKGLPPTNTPAAAVAAHGVEAAF